MHPLEDNQLTAEQRTEAYRHAHIAHLERQTKLLEKINGTMTFFLFVFIIGMVVGVLFVATAGR
jgi:hypothetical protein